MRPPRIVILALFFAACLFLLCRAITSIGRPAPVISQKSGFRSFFSFSAPFTLFPPNAVITIADDNSTSFAARPAAFGPPLPSKGLNGQLWIGSGFTEETMQDGEGEGELGCSDVPGWNDGTSTVILKTSMKEVQDKSKSVAATSKTKNQKRAQPKSPVVDRTAVAEPEPEPKSKNKPVDDGTDDYLHQHLDKSQKSPSDAPGSSSGHADIQSIQEGAEIAGKIVLLSRGGCGFLEKVKWAQRRGAVALIVGDNQRGGPLIQMYAHGDTSNVTIPSIFTSRTTAYLLSLMMQPGSFIEDIIDENGKPSLKVQQSEKARKSRIARQAAASQSTKASAITRSTKKLATRKRPAMTTPAASDSKPGWLARMFGLSSSSRVSRGSRSPTKNSQDWVLVEDFSDEKDKLIRNSLERASRRRGNDAYRSNMQQTSTDDFQIGVEDWRDPDLIGTDKPHSSGENSEESTSQGTGSGRTSNTKNPDLSGSRGSGRSSSSVEYVADHMPAKGKDAIGSGKSSKSTSRGGFISRIFGDDDGADFTKAEEQPKSADVPTIEKPPPGLGGTPPPEEREGLWVVITPSSGASPFFDTLLVLVISPLITLTVVYALLIIRARIRRRRWRAPKSVVERLPVRTYHTVASSPSHSSRVPSPTSSSPTTPLLQSQHGPSRSRPRSRTTTGVPSPSDLLDVDATLSTPRPPSRREGEKRHGPSEWKRYMGRQVECVVCLEEYVDGVSQVMSLPCGHEFHVDCITPWLTTRRRTCPICKGDVVRSLARGSPSSPRYEPYQDDSDDDDMVAQNIRSPSNDSPLPRNDDSDVEQGVSTSPHRSQQESWFGMLSNNLRDRFSRRGRAPDDDTEYRGR
ncbi:hypothetical protein F5X99DRAFT_326703 [Biscogniauxia marginata]|nr:hypothetical protein F5X99DRAFT_326703 [Biscogniauxia marginata]